MRVVMRAFPHTMTTHSSIVVPGRAAAICRLTDSAGAAGRSSGLTSETEVGSVELARGGAEELDRTPGRLERSAAGGRASLSHGCVKHHVVVRTLNVQLASSQPTQVDSCRGELPGSIVVSDRAIAVHHRAIMPALMPVSVKHDVSRDLWSPRRGRGVIEFVSEAGGFVAIASSSSASEIAEFVPYDMPIAPSGTHCQSRAYPNRASSLCLAADATRPSHSAECRIARNI